MEWLKRNQKVCSSCFIITPSDYMIIEPSNAIICENNKNKKRAQVAVSLSLSAWLELLIYQIFISIWYLLKLALRNVILATVL